MNLKFDRKLGHGEYGEVWKASDDLGRDLAVKFFREDGSQSNSLRQHGVIAQARLLVKLTNDNVVLVHAVIPARIPDDPARSSQIKFLTHAMVMEYIPGTSLKEMLETLKGRKLLPARAREIGEELLRGLKAFHEIGVIHGDLHSGNIQLMDNGGVKIIDPLHDTGGGPGPKSPANDLASARKLLISILDAAKVSSKSVKSCKPPDIPALLAAFQRSFDKSRSWLTILVLICGAMAILFPLAAELLSSRITSPSIRLLCHAGPAILALVVGVIAATKAQAMERALIVISLIAYCLFGSIIRGGTLTLPIAAVRDGAAEKAMTDAFSAQKGKLYDREPANLVTLEDVKAGCQEGGALIHVIARVIWTKKEIFPGLKRVYRGDLYFTGRYAKRVGGGLQVSEISMADYAISPSSGLPAYLMGFIEVDIMMIHHQQAINTRLEPEIKQAFTRSSVCR